MADFSITSLVGKEAIPYIDALADLRISVFHEYPYLYVGDLAYERNYLSTYVKCPEAIIILVKDDEGNIVGAATGLPLASEEADFRKPFEEQGYDLTRVFYFGESVLDRNHRGIGIGNQLFLGLESYAKSLARFDAFCFCAVIRPDSHPQRPKEYQALDGIWLKKGYQPVPNLQTTYSWREVGEATESPKAMQFWIKKI